MTTQSIKNVIIIGAAGAVGEPVLVELIASKKFNVTVLRRAGSASAVPAGIPSKDVDLNSVADLTRALAGQDAIISTVAAAAVPLQKNLIDAAIAAGVQRFMPSDFGSDLDNPIVRKLPVFAEKVKIHEYVMEKAKTTPLTWSSVANNAFLDWGLRHDFLIPLSNYKPRVIDGGSHVFSTTALNTVANAVVGILLNPEATKNRTVFIDDIKICQNRILELAKEVAPNKPWQEPVSDDSAELVEKSNARLAQGLFDLESFVPYLQRAAFSGKAGGRFDKTDNELLGLKPKTEEDVKRHLREILV